MAEFEAVERTVQGNLEPDRSASDAAGGTFGDCMPKKILIVDDEQLIADTLAVILRGCGYQVMVAYEAHGALHQCESVIPDLVISDVVMPGMNGVDLAVAIRERYPFCKVLLFSGQATSRDLLEGARERGYNFDLLQKPVHPNDLLAKIAQPDKPRATPHKPCATSQAADRGRIERPTSPFPPDTAAGPVT